MGLATAGGSEYIVNRSSIVPFRPKTIAYSLLLRPQSARKSQ